MNAIVERTHSVGSRSQAWARGVAWSLALLLSVLALAQATHKARKGECALLKWRPAVEALGRGEIIYGREDGGTREGFPTPPATALGLRPFLALGDVPAAIAWATFKVALCWFSIAVAMRMVSGRVREFPPWACVAILVLCSRVLLSDIAHGNINIPIAALIVAAGWEWSRGREARAGFWIGVAAVLKVTPVLFVLYFAWKRSWRGVLGALAGCVAFAVLVPAVFLGWGFNLELAAAWWQQMIAPYAAGQPLTAVQTEQIDQSLLGVLARLLTDSIAIRARPPIFASDVSINFAALTQFELRCVAYVAFAAVLAFVAWCTRMPRLARANATTLGEFAVVALAMLLLSERSWKQHYVTLILPITFLAWRMATTVTRDRVWWTCLIALAVSAAAHGLTGSGVLGERGSDLAEAYGLWLIGGLVLFIACGAVLRHDVKALQPARSVVDR